MSLFRSRRRLHASEGTSDEAIDYHSVRYLPLLVRDEAANTMQQLLSETREWRADKELENLSSNEADLDIRAPASWSDWVNAVTNIFSPVNRIVLLARTIANLKQAAGESVDTYELRVTQAYARLLAEAKRTAPTNVSPYKHAWQTCLMATSESGLLPQIRVELIREDPSVSYRASHTRAKRHESNALRGPTPSFPTPTTDASALTGTPAGTNPAHDRQLITSMANIEKAIVSQLAATRGRRKSVTFDASSYRPQEKRGRSKSRDHGRPRKSNPVANLCDYPVCRHRGFHSRAECRLAKTHES